jgi:ADP-ribosylglycohydrolase
VPAPPWHYTDDTEMALSVAECLTLHGQIVPDVLAAGFARRFSDWRGYGRGMFRLLGALRNGADWRIESAALFGGRGSYGNGAAARAAPIGAFLAEDLAAVRENALLSARPTHAHPEAAAGAVAVAVSAALAVQPRLGGNLSATAFLGQVAEQVPQSQTRHSIERAARIPHRISPAEVARELGSGYAASSQDTVPFALWCAAGHLDSFPEAFWTTISGRGDLDTTCAIACGIVAVSARAEGIPPAWLEAREPLQLETSETP